MRTMSEQAAAVREQRVSPVELVQRSLEEIERVQPVLNAFTTVLGEDALLRAKELEAGDPVGPLHGVPIAIKDLYDIEGVATTGCCAAYLDRIARADSPVVAKLRDAGAIVVAKTNMHELAFGATTQVSCFGPCRNPWDVARIPAGSSGGSGAAVATRVVTMAMGSDTGGSIRMPSSMCGVTGLKPTHGAVSLRGALPMTASFDTAGPLAVSARDCALVNELIAGFDAGYLYSAAGEPAAVPNGVEGLRIGLMTHWLLAADPQVQTAVRNAAETFERLGCRVLETDGFDPLGLRDEVSAVLVAEFANHYRDLWDDERLSDPIKTLMDIGRGIKGADYAAGREAALSILASFRKQLASVDALLVPCAPFQAPKAEEVDNLTEAIRSTIYTLPVNAAGLPALAFPVGSSTDGLPLGAQLIGGTWSEQRLCAIGAAYQEATDWHLQVPLLAGTAAG